VQNTTWCWRGGVAKKKATQHTQACWRGGVAHKKTKGYVMYVICRRTGVVRWSTWSWASWTACLSVHVNVPKVAEPKSATIQAPLPFLYTLVSLRSRCDTGPATPPPPADDDAAEREEGGTACIACTASTTCRKIGQMSSASRDAGEREGLLLLLLPDGPTDSLQ
jgi:hypothetical protein